MALTPEIMVASNSKLYLSASKKVCVDSSLKMPKGGMANCRVHATL